MILNYTVFRFVSSVIISCFSVHSLIIPDIIFSLFFRTKALVLELLAAVCLVRGGHEIILSAFDNFKEVRAAKMVRRRRICHYILLQTVTQPWRNARLAVVRPAYSSLLQRDSV